MTPTRRGREKEETMEKELWNGWNQIAGAVLSSGLDGGIEGAISPPEGAGAEEPPVSEGAGASPEPEPASGAPVAGQPQKLRDKPPTQERINELYKNWKTQEEENETLKAEIADLRLQAQRQPAAPPPSPAARPAPAQPGQYQAPRHLSQLAQNPEFAPVLELIEDAIKYHLGQEVKPLREKFTTWEQEQEFSKIQAQGAQQHAYFKSQFEAQGKPIADELGLFDEKRFHPLVAETICRKAVEELDPLLRSLDQQVKQGLISEQRFWLIYKSNWRAALEKYAALLPSLAKGGPDAPQPEGEPVASKLGGTAPIKTPDPMMEKFKKGEVTDDEVMADFVEKRRAKRR
jgi:hypothetical protein